MSSNVPKQPTIPPMPGDGLEIDMHGDFIETMISMMNYALTHETDTVSFDIETENINVSMDVTFHVILKGELMEVDNESASSL